MKKRKQSPTLKMVDAIFVWHRHWDGLYQHQIAATLGCNQGRVSEVLNGHRLSGSKLKAKELYSF